MKKQTEINTARFALWPSARGGFAFVFKNWEYLLKISFPAAILQFATNYYLQFVNKDTTPMESFLWGLPASVFIAWITFAVVRFMVFKNGWINHRQDQKIWNRGEPVYNYRSFYLCYSALRLS